MLVSAPKNAKNIFPIGMLGVHASVVSIPVLKQRVHIGVANILVGGPAEGTLEHVVSVSNQAVISFSKYLIS